MDIVTLSQATQHIGLPALLLSFLAGFLFSINPVSLAALPVSLAYTTKARTPRQALLFGGMFLAGLLATHLTLGVAAAIAGSAVQAWLHPFWGAVVGPWLILLGVFWPGWVRIPWRGLPLRARRATGPTGAFLLGIPFAIAFCPACTPALAVLLGVAAGLGSVVWGGALLLAFAVGRTIPIVVGAVSMGWLQRLQPLAKYRRVVDTAGGLTLILAGLYMLNTYFFWVPALVGSP